MLDLLCFILAIIVILAVYKGIKFIGKFEWGKIFLTFYLVVNLASDFIDLLIKVLK